MKYFIFKTLNLFYCLIFIISFQKCIDPTVPEFQFAEDLIFIDGFITDKPKGSYVSVKKSKLEYKCNNLINDDIFALVSVKQCYYKQ